jgi:hypothetical protein
MYVRFPLSLRNVEDLLHERGIDVYHESVRLLVDRFGTYFADKVRKRRSEALGRVNQWHWHLDEVFMKIPGWTHYLWRSGTEFLFYPIRSAFQKMAPEGGDLVIADVILCLDEAEDAAVTQAGLIKRRLDIGRVRL